MKRTAIWMGVVMLVVLSAAPAAWSQEKAASAPASQPAAQEARPDTVGRGLMVMGACIGAALAAAFGGMAIGRIATACLESTARQPEAAGALFSPMIITAAMVEGCILFAIVIALMGIMK